MTQAFPLAWPPGWPRTKPSDRMTPKFSRQRRNQHGFVVHRELTVADARQRLQAELDALRASLPVLSSNIELRLDGQPRSARREPEDPGVAVYFQIGKKPRVLACDRWNTVAGNIAAIAAHIGAMRGMDRWGVGTTEQLFEGFAALPAATAGQRHWREVLQMIGKDYGPGAASPSRVMLEETRRRLAMSAHPDRGGSDARMAEINAAFAQAVKELGL